MQTPITHEAPAIAAEPVNAVAVLRTLRAHGIEPDSLATMRDGSFSLKFVSGQSRYWATRVLKALPDAALVSRGDGLEVCLVRVRV